MHRDGGPQLDRALAFEHDGHGLAVGGGGVDDGLAAEIFDQVDPHIGKFHPEPSASVMCSGRMPSVVAPAAGRPRASAVPPVRMVSPVALVARKFIFGEPMKPATNRLRGVL